MHEIAPQPVEDNEFSEDFRALLAELNRVIARTGEGMEGSYFYGTDPRGFPNVSPLPVMRSKRSNLVRAATGRKRMLEIGLNGGHSALLVLHHIPDIEFHGVDIAYHRYTRPAANFLKKHFRDRFHFYPANSCFLLPRLAVMKPSLTFDLMHIDGDHRAPVAESDFFNCLRIAADPAWIIFDDTTKLYPHLIESVDRFITCGLVREDHQDGQWKGGGHRLLRVLRKTVEVR